MATVKYYLKPLNSSPEASIHLKFTVDRSTRIEVATGERILPKFWNPKAQEVKSNFTGHIELNRHLGDLKNSILEFWRDNKTCGSDRLRDSVHGLAKFGAISQEKKSLFPILNSFIDQYRKEKDYKTTQKFESLRRKLKTFNPSLRIDALDFNFYDAFKNFLYTNDGGNLFDSSVYKYLINLKTFLTWAHRREYPVHLTGNLPTHNKWEIIRRRYPPISLKLEELQKLEELNITPELISAHFKFPKHTRSDQHILTAEALSIARDYLVLECRTGQRISDLKRFSLSQIQNERWIFHPKKGNRISAKTIYFPLNTEFTRPAWRIFEKHGFALPPISEKNLNLNIKTVCELAGITNMVNVYRWKGNERIERTVPKYKLISTHTGRKTFITIALQFMPPKIVKDLVGIESYETLKHYEDLSQNNLVDQYFNKMAEKIELIRKAD